MFAEPRHMHSPELPCRPELRGITPWGNIAEATVRRYSDGMFSKFPLGNPGSAATARRRKHEQAQTSSVGSDV